MTVPATVWALAARWVDFLIRESLYVSVVFCVVLALSFAWRRRGPAVHLALWSLIFIRLVLPTDLAHPLSVGAFVQQALAVRVETQENGLAGHGLAEGLPFESRSGGLLIFPDRRYGWRTGLAVLWLMGFAAVLRRNDRRLGVFRRAVNRAASNDQPALQPVVQRWRRLLGVRRPVRVVSSSEELSPFTIGIFRPVIFLPTAVVEDPASLEPVIAHEMAHVARLDALWLRLQHFLQAVYFFHPLVWISGARLDRERERLCDATVVTGGRMAARDYAGGLLNVLRLELKGAGAPTMSARKRRIGVRIQKILDRDGGNRPRLVTAIATVSAIGVFLLPLASYSEDAAPAGEKAPTNTAADSENAPQTSAGDFANPLPGGRITRSWGAGHHDPFTGKEVFHRGIDVAAKAGTPVLVVAAGVVAVAAAEYEPQPGAGTVVMVDHGNGITTYYGHLESFDVEEGQRVAQGDVIASVGSTGRSTGPHLHFEVRSNDEFLNPADFVDDWK